MAVVVSQFLAAQAQLQHQRLSVQQLSAQSVLGLAVHAIYESAQLTAALSGVLQTRRQHAQAFQLVFLQPDLLQSRLALIEAGAHAVVHQISQVAVVLEKCLPTMKLSREGLHPITTGLVARLPWSFVE